MKVIKLKDLLHEVQLKTESPAMDVPPEARITVPYAQHAYAKAASDSAGKPYVQANIDFRQAGQSESGLISKVTNVIKRFENSTSNPRGGYNQKLKKWFPHKSLEGGADTIAYGHKIQKGENFSAGITDSEANVLLEKDIKAKVVTAKRLIKNFDSLPITVQIATINAFFRGDMGPKTIELLSKNKFREAAIEYLDHKEYKTTTKQGVKKRMDWNAEVFRSAG
jgi:hypothetical protein